MKFLVLAVLFVLPVAVFAAETNTTTTNSTTVATPKKDEVDQEITNARLRATTGAKSTLSLQTAFTYSGSSIDHPFAKERPKLTPGTVTIDPAKITGTISAKWRATSRDNINLGIGVGWLTPTYEGQKGQAENPYISYGRTFKFGNIQNVTNVVLLKYTALADVQRYLNFQTGIDHIFLTNWNKFQLGLVVSLYHEFYSQKATGTQDRAGLYPYMEYPFSDTFSFRTVYRGFTFYNRANDPGRIVRDEPTQSAGLGLSVTRDIYFYPNLQWVWADMRSEKTNFAVSANVNL